LIEWLTSGKPFGGVERDNVRVTAGREILPTSGRLDVRRYSKSAVPSRLAVSNPSPARIE